MDTRKLCFTLQTLKPAFRNDHIEICGGEINKQLVVYKNFRGVKIFHLLFVAIRLLEYILLIKEQIA